MEPTLPALNGYPDDGKLLPGAERLCSLAVKFIATTVFLVGLSNFLVWYLPELQKAATEMGAMIVRVNTALALVTGAISLWIWHLEPRWRAARWGGILFGGIPVLVGGLTTLEYLLDWNLGIDQLLAPATFPGDIAQAAVRAPGRMSLNASSALFLLGLGLVLLDWRPRWARIQVATALVSIGALPAFLGLVGYLLGQSGFTGILRSTNILFHAAACMLLLAAGILLLRPLRQPLRGLLSAGADGVLLRWLLPGSATVLLVLGAAIGRGRALGMVQPGEGTALMLFGGMVLLFGLIAAAARAARLQEQKTLKVALALRDRERLSQLMLDTSLDGVVLMSAAGEVMDWNAAAETIFGWTRDEIIGKPLAGHVISQEVLAPFGGRIDQAAEAFGRRLEVAARRRNGEEFPAEFVLNALQETPAPMFVAFVRDITEQKASQNALRAAKERAEKASQAKDDFLAALSHELRTPLTPVLLSAATLETDPSVPEPVRKELAMIERNIALEARLIDDLLDLTRIAKGKLLLRRETCDLHDLLGHAVDIVRDEAQGRRLNLNLSCRAARSSLQGDSARLQQVFWNLLKNAVKFTPRGGAINVSTRDGDEDGVFVLEVRDSGIGFTPEVADRLFMPFEQGKVLDHQFGGLGLGLAIARAIVELHGGKITAHSDGAGAGATFCVRFPGASARPAELPGQGSAPAAAADELGPLNVLLVEDHEPTRTVLTQLLKRAGNQVCAAGSVAEAVAAMDALDGFDVVISDLGLPDGSGLDLMPQLRSRAKHLPGIALSGYGMEEDLQKSAEAGFAIHLVKPIKMAQLRDALRQVRQRPVDKK